MALRRRSARRVGRTVLSVLAAAAAAALVVPRLGRPPWEFFDLQVYRGAIQWWQSGQSLYSFTRAGTVYGFTYPPFAALVLAPLALGRWQVQAVLLTAASVAVVVVTTTRSVGPVARRAGWRPGVAVPVAVVLTLVMSPVKETLAFGQINLLLVALVLADVVALRRGWRWAGVGTGVAAAVKLTPAIFVLYFLLTRRRQPAAVAVATFVTVTALTFVATPRTSEQYWAHTLWETSRVGRVDKTSNQSLLGMLARIDGPSPPQLLWAVIAGLVLVIGMWRATRAFGHGDELVGLTITGLVAGLISPISWTHHLYWLVPAVVVLVDVGAGRSILPHWPWSRLAERGRVRVALGSAAVIFLACASEFIWFFQRDEGLTHIGGPIGAVGENILTLAMVALVLVLPARSTVPVARPAADGRPVSLAAD